MRKFLMTLLRLKTQSMKPDQFTENFQDKIGPREAYVGHSVFTITVRYPSGNTKLKEYFAHFWVNVDTRKIRFEIIGPDDSYKTHEYFHRWVIPYANSQLEVGLIGFPSEFTKAYMLKRGYVFVKEPKDNSDGYFKMEN